MTKIRLLAGLAVLAMAVAVAGCGGTEGDSVGESAPSASTDNTSKVEAAAVADASGASVEKTLERKLGAHKDPQEEEFNEEYGIEEPPVENSEFDIPGGTCHIGQIVDGAEVSLYEEQAWSLVSPDGLALVEVSGSSAPDAPCMTAVQEALGW